MAYDSDKKPSGLSTITSLENDDTIIVGDTSDTTEVVKTISWTNLKSAVTTLVEGLSSYFNVTTGTSDDITEGVTNLYATTANVTSAGALMDSEVTNLAQVKAFDSTDYATAAQGATADTALQPTDIASSTITPRTGAINFSGGSDGDVLTVQADGSLAPETPAAGGGTVDTSGTPVANDFARFTDANTIEGRSYAEVKADLDLEIGTDVQAYNAKLSSIAGLTPASSLIIGNGLGGYEMVTPANFITNNNILDTADIGVSVQAYDANLPSWPATVDATEVGYLNGVTSAIQTQIDAKYESGDSPTFTEIDYTRADGAVSALGNLGATEAVDWATATHFTGTLDSNVTITHSNEVSGRKVTLYLAYDGSAQRTITWSDVDKWLDNSAGSAPAAPSASGEVLVVTMQYVGTTCYASATGNYAVYA